MEDDDQHRLTKALEALRLLEQERDRLEKAMREARELLANLEILLSPAPAPKDGSKVEDSAQDPRC